MAKKTAEVDVINAQLNILDSKVKKAKQFEELLESIDGLDDKKRILWILLCN